MATTTEKASGGKDWAGAATRMVAAAEARERAKAAKALRRWLPMRQAQLALERAGRMRQAQLALERAGRPPAEGTATDAELIDTLLAAWGAAEAFTKADRAESGS